MWYLTLFINGDDDDDDKKLFFYSLLTDRNPVNAINFFFPMFPFHPPENKTLDFLMFSGGSKGYFGGEGALIVAGTITRGSYHITNIQYTLTKLHLQRTSVLTLLTKVLYGTIHIVHTQKSPKNQHFLPLIRRRTLQ